MIKKVVAVILILGALGLLGYWFKEGHRWATQKQVLVEQKDELFGTTTQKWVDEYHPGISDSYIGPTVAILLVASGILFWSAARGKRAAATS